MDPPYTQIAVYYRHPHPHPAQNIYYIYHIVIYAKMLGDKDIEERLNGMNIKVVV